MSTYNIQINCTNNNKARLYRVTFEQDSGKNESSYKLVFGTEEDIKIKYRDSYITNIEVIDHNNIIESFTILHPKEIGYLQRDKRKREEEKIAIKNKKMRETMEQLEKEVQDISQLMNNYKQKYNVK